MGKDSHRGRRRRGGQFAQLTYTMIDSPAWLDLSGVAVKMLCHLMRLSQGNNGWGHKGERGELFLGERGAARAIGVSRNTAARAFAELETHGFLRPVRRGHFHVKIRQATVWRLTFEPHPHAHQGPTNEWRNWRPEQNSRAQNLNGTGSKIGRSSEYHLLTGPEIEPVKINKDGNPPISVGSNSEPHIDVPEGGAPPGAMCATIGR